MVYYRLLSGTYDFALQVSMPPSVPSRRAANGSRPRPRSHGLRENLQEKPNPYLVGKNKHGFRFRISLKPTHWIKHPEISSYKYELLFFFKYLYHFISRIWRIIYRIHYYLQYIIVLAVLVSYILAYVTCFVCCHIHFIVWCLSYYIVLYYTVYYIIYSIYILYNTILCYIGLHYSILYILCYIYYSIIYISHYGVFIL